MRTSQVKQVKLPALLPVLKELVGHIQAAGNMIEKDGDLLKDVDALAKKMEMRLIAWDPKLMVGLRRKPLLRDRGTKKALARFIAGLVIAVETD